MKNDSIYQNCPQKHLIIDKHNKKNPKVLRQKSSILYLQSSVKLTQHTGEF